MEIGTGFLAEVHGNRTRCWTMALLGLHGFGLVMVKVGWDAENPRYSNFL